MIQDDICHMEGVLSSGIADDGRVMTGIAVFQPPLLRFPKILAKRFGK